MSHVSIGRSTTAGGSLSLFPPIPGNGGQVTGPHVGATQALPRSVGGEAGGHGQARSEQHESLRRVTGQPGAGTPHGQDQRIRRQGRASLPPHRGTGSIAGRGRKPLSSPVDQHHRSNSDGPSWPPRQLPDDGATGSTLHSSEPHNHQRQSVHPEHLHKVRPDHSPPTNTPACRP